MKNKNICTQKAAAALICGMLGCLCMGGGDWLMMYGDTAHSGSIYWLTEGVSHIEPWRNALAMAIAFPAIILYGIALFYIGKFISAEKQQKVYHYLTAFGLTPWLCLHLFYVMILFGFAWLNNNGYAEAAIPFSEALIGQFSWIVYISEAIMLPPYVYWFYLMVSGKSCMPKAMAVSNPLIIYVILSSVKSLMPDSPFRIGFTNGLMSESMLIWFGSILVWLISKRKTFVRQEMSK
ncbi:MAG: DUF6796 family protein [Ruminiclostridium sp.]